MPRQLKEQYRNNAIVVGGTGRLIHFDAEGYITNSKELTRGDIDPLENFFVPEVKATTTKKPTTTQAPTTTVEPTTTAAPTTTVAPTTTEKEEQTTAEAPTTTAAPVKKTRKKKETGE